MEALGLSVEEAAEAIGIGRSEFFEILSRGEIDSFKVGRRRIIPADAVRRFVAEQVAAMRADRESGAAR